MRLQSPAFFFFLIRLNDVRFAPVDYRRRLYRFGRNFEDPLFVTVNYTAVDAGWRLRIWLNSFAIDQPRF